MARPTLGDESVNDAFIEDFYEDVKAWYPGYYNPENIKSDLKDLFKHHRSMQDGYDLAKFLDRKGWDPDSELVEILDGAWHTENRALSKIVKEWVKAEDIKPVHSVGDWVSHEHHEHGVIQFEITKINYEEAKYRLTSEAIGHVKEGKNDIIRNGTLGIIVPFEAVDTVEERVSTTPLFKKEED